jgi:hypothetical protein
MVWGSVPGSTVGVGVGACVGLGLGVCVAFVVRGVADGRVWGASDEVLQPAVSRANAARARATRDVRRGSTQGSLRVLVYWEAN